ncbi:hypothetical protein Tco_1449389 [Tanacetum coccineum]
MAKRAQPVLYDADTLLHPAHHPVRIWDSEDVLVHQVVSMKKMSEKPGHVRPMNGFYEKLNALMFVPQKDLSGDQAYWLSANEIDLHATREENTKVLELGAEISTRVKTADYCNLKNVFAFLEQKLCSTEGSCVQQALDTDRIQLKDTITSLGVQLDGLKCLHAENTKLKAQVTGKTSSGPSTSEKPKVLASGMYTNSSKYIPPPKRANWVKPTPLPKKKQVTFQEPPRTSNRPTQKP